MNTRILTPLALSVGLAFTGCARKEAPLTETQKAMVREEVVRAMQAMIGGQESALPPQPVPIPQPKAL